MPVVRAGLTPHTLRQLKTKVQWSQHYLSVDKKYIGTNLVILELSGTRCGYQEFSLFGIIKQF